MSNSLGCIAAALGTFLVKNWHFRIYRFYWLSIDTVWTYYISINLSRRDVHDDIQLIWGCGCSGQNSLEKLFSAFFGVIGQVQLLKLTSKVTNVIHILVDLVETNRMVPILLWKWDFFIKRSFFGHFDHALSGVVMICHKKKTQLDFFFIKSFRMRYNSCVYSIVTLGRKWSVCGHFWPRMTKSSQVLLNLDELCRL